MTIRLAALSVLGSMLLAQAPSSVGTVKPPVAVPSKPAIAKPAVARPAVPASGVDPIIALVKGGMSETLVLKTIQRGGKAYNLTPADMLKLQQAGVSETIIGAMMDPASVDASAATAAAASATPVAARSEAPSEPVQISRAPVKPKAPRKRKIAVMAFDHSSVARWVRYWFHTDHNVGQGIRAMLTARMGQLKNVTLLERERMDAIEKELKFNNTSMVNQGTKAKMGKVTGADCLLLGDITIFGRDDKAESSRASGFGRIAGRLPGLGGQVASGMGTFHKEEKAVVGIALRIVDTETGEVLTTAEARGESKRESKSWDSFTYGRNGGMRADSETMTSSNFQETIIGEATSDAVDKILAILDERVPTLPMRGRTIEGRLAKAGSNPIIAIGTNDGVEAGDRFEILQIVDEVVDPTTKEVIDVDARTVGELTATNVREKTTTGTYSGTALSETWKKGYVARLITQ